MKKIYMILGVFGVTFLFVFLQINKEQVALENIETIQKQNDILNETIDFKEETKDEMISADKDNKDENKDVMISADNDNKDDKMENKNTSGKKNTKKHTNKNTKIYKINIPTFNQKKEGYPRGCEGVSLYMCLKGKGYINSLSIDEFMNTMPLSYDDNPDNGFVGDPTQGKNANINKGKRTTIHPTPLTNWGNQFGKCKNLEGQSIKELISELKKGNPIIVWVTSSWNTPQYATYSFGKTVSNNHATCLVGYDEKTEQFLINDCSSKNNGEYWIDRSLFEKTYNPRKYAVVVL